MKPRILILTGIALAGCALALFSAGCGQKKAEGGGKAAGPQATPVDVIPVSLGTIAQTVSVVGSLQTLFSVNLSSNTTGRLTNVFVREGDFVHKGQIVAQIDPVQLQAAVQQDQANLLSAQAKLAQSQVQYTQSITNSNVAVETAKSQLISAQATLNKTTEGDQTQAKLQAKDNLIQQQANFDNAQTNFQRQTQLYQQGAIAKSDLDNATNTYETQQALLDNYKQALSLALQGGRIEDVQAQQQVVAQDKANLSNARANLANIAVDKQAIQANIAAVDQVKAQLVQAQKQLSDTNIVSSIDGYVSQRSQDPGAIAQPGTTILQIVDLHTVYYQPTVSATDFQSLHSGQPVTVRVDAYPGKAYHGVVTSVFPSASATTRQFSLRVTIPNPGLDLRPGMYARGAITTEKHTNVVVVPFSALVPRDLGQGFDPNNSSNGVATGGTTLPAQSVFIVSQKKTATIQPVETGIVTANQIEITSGIKPGDLLIVKGQSQIQPGDRVLPNTVGTQKTADALNASSMQ